MSKVAKLDIDGKVHEFPIVEGTEGESSIDISSLRSKTGHITLDEGYMNTGTQRSSATPMGAITTTTPILTKEQNKKDMLN